MSRLKLTKSQRDLYRTEKLMNFRTISKLVATRSSKPLTSSDHVSDAIVVELAEIGQFAELAYFTAYSGHPFEYAFTHLADLIQVDFPYEGYDALADAQLVRSIRGSAADLGAFVAYRPSTRQLIVAISGTSTTTQALYDLRTTMHRYRHAPEASVHTGFWKLYKGIRQDVIAGIGTGLESHAPRELVITGHSMGGAVAYLLALDLLRDHKSEISHDVSFKLIVFGAPRCGNNKLVQHWLDVKRSWNSERGHEKCAEISVKAFNDGVPALPPTYLGFRHFAQNPYYLAHGRLYSVPSSEREHTLFRVDDENVKTGSIDFPKGGHNYYNGRSFERTRNRILWLERWMGQEDSSSWQEKYRAKVAKGEHPKRIWER